MYFPNVLFIVYGVILVAAAVLTKMGKIGK